MQTVVGGEYQVIERAKLRKQSFDSWFVRKVNAVPLRVFAQRLNGLLNSFRVALRDNDLGAL